MNIRAEWHDPDYYYQPPKYVNIIKIEQKDVQPGAWAVNEHGKIAHYYLKDLTVIDKEYMS